MKIENEIKTKVFAQYLGQNVSVRKMNDRNKDFLIGRICEVTLNSNHGDWVRVWFNDVYEVTYNTHNTSSSNSHTFFFGEDETKLVLKPLSAITDEDAIEVSNILKNLDTAYAHTFDKRPENIKKYPLTYATKHFLTAQFLQSKGYDLPNYLLGGKTLHEVGLAIYE